LRPSVRSTIGNIRGSLAVSVTRVLDLSAAPPLTTAAASSRSE
jgi:hypothetical protein